MLTYFMPLIFFSILPENMENLGFLMFSEDTERHQWFEMT